MILSPRHYKIIFVGNNGAGKASLIRSLFELSEVPYDYNNYRNEFKYSYTPPAQSLYDQTISSLNLTIVPIHIYQYRHDRGYHQAFRGSHLTVIVTDLSSQQSCKDLKNWGHEVARYCPDTTKVLVVGTKSDLIEQRVMSKVDIVEITDSLNYYYIETSTTPSSSSTTSTTTNNNNSSTTTMTTTTCKDQFFKLLIDIFNQQFIEDIISFADNNLYKLRPISLSSLLNINNKKKKVEKKPKKVKNHASSSSCYIFETLFHYVFKCKLIMNNIFDQVRAIHKTLGLRSHKLSYTGSDFWFSHPNFIYLLKYRQKYKYPSIPLQLNISSQQQHHRTLPTFNENNASIFLTTNTDLELFEYYFQPSVNNYTPPTTSTATTQQQSNLIQNSWNSRMIDYCCVSGSLEIVEYLYKKHGFQFTAYGFMMSIVFNNINITKFIIDQSEFSECIAIDSSIQSSSTTTAETTSTTTTPTNHSPIPFCMTSDLMKEGIKLAENYGRSVILKYLRGLENSGKDHSSPSKPFFKRFTSLFK